MSFLGSRSDLLLMASTDSLEVVRILFAMIVSSLGAETLSSFFNKAMSSTMAGRGGAVRAGLN